MEKLKLKSIYSEFRTDLEFIERELNRSVHSASPMLEDACLALIGSGGKRIRPVFTLLASKFGDYNPSVTAKAAVPLELIHMASLVHDDVIDDADLRRGERTVKSIHGNRAAMYVGDFLLGRSLEIIGELDSQEVHRVLSRTMIEICVGEIIQIEDKFAAEQNLRDYLRRIKRKTALLISSSCELGGLVAGADPATVRKLKRFGYYVGMSFQITDDLLDFTGTEKQLGKPAGGDLLAGNITLPAIYGLRDPELRPYLLDALGGGLDKAGVAKLLGLMRNSEAIRESVRISDLYLEKALREAEALPDIPDRDSLIRIAKFIGKRKF
ncbi:heptaprenyl diphosphate synthase [Bhargavaea ginsengi]|uniref:Heptaprenyl diphosphate synthase n=1 Tax=Bhargavaea ginsengi TaxID=426757 RepID=A0A1H6SN40_9BACL|nr:polyprenyl synthetase family protein [Bhargavaea ginsengi]MCM3088220.1 polyprenyl synthetase family protein [Bhargavaea ginsengi]SEI65265.1 heptaprenyl diphosphate synthase [Bhargavaea ginsengi]